MGNLRTSGITLILIIILLMVGIITATSVVNEGTGGETTEEDYEQMVQEIIDDISTIIDVKDQKCRFSMSEGVLKIEKIAILISPKVSQDIDFNSLTIQLDDGNYVDFLTYSGLAQDISDDTLFEHNIWDSLNDSNFAFISINDFDNSLIDFDSFNENSDNAYLIFKLSEPRRLEKHEEMTVTLFPSSGLVTKLYLKAPLPTRLVRTFE